MNRNSIFKSGRGLVLLLALVLGLALSAGTVPVAQAETITVCPSGCSNATIQAAIDSATDGDTINIAAGTYVENININKKVSLVGAGSGDNPAVDTVLQKSSSAAVVTISGSGSSTGDPLLLKNIRIMPVGVYGINIGNASFIKLDNVHVVGSNPTNQTESEVGLKIATTATVSGLEIVDSAFDHLAYGWYFAKHGDWGPGGSNVTNVTVLRTSFSYNDAKGLYVEKLSDASFTECIVVDNGVFTGFWNKKWNGGFDINLKGQETYQNISITNSTFTGNGLGLQEGAAVMIKGRDDGATYGAHPALLVGVTFSGNTVTGNERGVRFGEPNQGNLGPTNAVVMNNSLFGNVQTYVNVGEGLGSAYGDLVDMTAASNTINTSGNWWGDTDPVGQFFGNVAYSPWLGAVPSTVPMTWYTNGSIQSAIDAATDGDTINVAAETYVESVNVNKSLTLNGAQAGIDPNIGSRGSESTVSGLITVASDGVTIDGFSITNPSGTGGISASGRSNLAITNNVFTSIGNTSVSGATHAIAIVSAGTPTSNITISQNQFSDLHGGYNAALTGSAAKSNNGSASAVSVGWSNATVNVDDVVISENVISNVYAATAEWNEGGKGAYGILFNVGYSGPAQAMNAQIRNNTISQLEGLWAHGIGLEGDTPNAVVLGNDISNLTDHKSPSDAIAVFFEGNASADTVGVHFNTFENVAVGVGAVGSSTPINATNNWWGDGSGPSDGGLGTTDPSTGTPADGSGAIVGPGIAFDPWLGAETTEVSSGTPASGESVSLPGGGVVVENTGSGSPTVIIAEYTGDPGSVGTFGSAGSYYDINVSGSTAGDSLEITMNAGGATGSLYYYNGSGWVPVVAHSGTPSALGSVSPVADEYVFTLNNVDTQPLLSELTGTAFTGASEEIGLTPSVTELAAGETLTVKVEAVSGALYGVDVSLAFDATYLEVTKVELGGSDANDLYADTVAVNTTGAGTLRFAYTQKSPRVNVTGDSSSPILLATITFGAKTNGTGTVYIDSAQFTDINGVEAIPGIVDDSSNQVELTINPSPTVFAAVALQGRSDHAGMQLEIKPTGVGNVLYDTSVLAGQLEVENVPAGTYTARVSAPKYLAAMQDFTVVANVASHDLTSVTLRGGDINADDQINIQDLVMIGVNFGSTTILTADINGDGVVNIQDLAIAAGNFGLETAGPTYTAPWE